jgi:hypothetical protein
MTLIFQQFLASGQVHLTAEQRESGDTLRIKIKELSASTSDHLDPRKVLLDPRWKEIRLAAQAFLTTLGPTA